MSDNKTLIYLLSDGTQMPLMVDAGQYWMPYKEIAKLYGRDESTIRAHICGIFSSGELDLRTVSKVMPFLASDNKTYQVLHYNIDMILAIGYRTHSTKAIEVRNWFNNHKLLVVENSETISSILKPYTQPLHSFK